MADRIAVMEGGELQQYGPSLDLRRRPANLYVATFLGEPPMNALAGVAQSDGIVLDDSAGALLALPGVRLPKPGTRIVLGLRPHRLHLGQSGLGGRVISNQWLGDQAHVVLELGEKIVVIVAHARVAVRVGERVSFGFAPEDAHVFDEATGRALSHGAQPA